MANLTRIEIIGPFVRGKRRGETLTVPTGSPEERAWIATGQVRATVLVGRGAPTVQTPAPKRGEIVALEAADTLEALAQKAEAHGPQAVEAVRLGLRTNPKALASLVVLLGLSVGLAEASPVEPSPAPDLSPEDAETRAELLALLELAADAGPAEILGAISALKAPAEPSGEPDAAFLAELVQLLGLPVDASTDAILDAVEDLRAAPPAETGGEVAPEDVHVGAGAILLAELLATPDAFTVSGIRLVASKNGIDLPTSGGKAELLEVVRLAVAGASAPAPAPEVATPEPSAFLDELDKPQA